MNRRDFLKGLAALTAVAATPEVIASALDRWAGKRIIEGETFYLSSAFHIPAIDGWGLHRCTFIQTAPITEKALIIVDEGARNGLMSYCRIEAMQMKPDQYAIWAPGLGNSIMYNDIFYSTAH